MKAEPITVKLLFFVRILFMSGFICSRRRRHVGIIRIQFEQLDRVLVVNSIGRLLHVGRDQFVSPENKFNQMCYTNCLEKQERLNY